LPKCDDCLKTLEFDIIKTTISVCSAFVTAAGRNIRSGIKEKYEKDNLGNFSAVFGDVLSVVARRNVLVRVTADFSKNSVSLS
jgi:hypothetical protein